jgi:COMPASS component SWD1
VDENVEYEEREDEFDVEDEQVILERKTKAEEEDVDIDSMAIVVDGHTGGGGGRSANAGSGVISPITPSGQTTPGPVTVNGITLNGTGKTDVTPLPTPGTDTEFGTVVKPGAGDAAMTPLAENPPSNAAGGTCPYPCFTQAIREPWYCLVVLICLLSPLASVVETDPDILWAQEDPDDDLPSLWRMKIVMEEDEDE